jgi:glycosyltransferase involved in cell wall biosynthesis
MGVDTMRFSPRSPSPPAGEGAGARGQRILFVGQLIDRKGVDVLLDALAGLSLDFRLEVVGDGPRRAALAEQARRLGIAGRITFHGMVPQESLPDFYRRADLFVGPSREEPLGLVFLEAAATGCPIVATRAGGIPEILTDGDTALLVPPDDPAALRAAIGRALTDLPLRRRLIDGALSVAHWNSLAQSIEHTLATYRSLLAS